MTILSLTATVYNREGYVTYVCFRKLEYGIDLRNHCFNDIIKSMAKKNLSFDRFPKASYCTYGREFCDYPKARLVLMLY